MFNAVKWNRIRSSAAIITALHNELYQKTKAGTVDNADDAFVKQQCICLARCSRDQIWSVCLHLEVLIVHDSEHLYFQKP